MLSDHPPSSPLTCEINVDVLIGGLEHSSCPVTILFHSLNGFCSSFGLKDIWCFSSVNKVLARWWDSESSKCSYSKILPLLNVQLK